MWQNWSGTETTHPVRVAEPRDVDDVVGLVQRAREERSTLKMVGTGHSFTGIAAPEHTMLNPTSMSGVVAVDREAMTVTALAGTPLHVLNATLEGLGLSLHNMGDIAEQTLAGAVSTGTHGTGGVAAGLAAQVVGLEMVTGTGEVLRADAEHHPDVLAVARLGLGALGVLTTLTFAVEPLFVLEAHERPLGWDEALGSFDDLVAAHHHVDLYWFPHTDRVQAKCNDRLDVPLEEARPLPRWRHRLDDDLLQNTAFGALTALSARVPRLVPPINRASSTMLSERTYSDVAHRVFTARRSVVFREMEYAVPREAGLAALREARAAIEASGLRISFPVEVRTAPADDVPLSTASGRDSTYLAFHTHRSVPHEEYFALLEPIMRAHDGRPHWGKLHSRTADDLAPAYPRFEEFLAVRERLDPDRVLTNAYLRRVLGD
ncbi:FAD-linked oxidoreductase [Nocardioides marinisabuli]|uniref:FAD-linked oxidoreductase n=1 Tax=Nocardioides marinisabuli TaxID=419476 RepID=A0A7Y9F459_9ACTN|nr:D-arabinono-1,4-lactone oxidase [Nocardioides marinisabuli]NYD59307.1 FAD-linked oxidoreductase [Nocardioides marinisabuli]